MDITLSVNVGHMLPVISSLIDAGWKPVTVPRGGNLPRNRLLLSLQTPDGERNYRLHVYKVTVSSRNREWERRIEITSTYQGNLQKSPGFIDVVLGFDADNDIFVGVDPIRLNYGGPTTNASSFLELDGLRWKYKYQIGIWSRATELLPEGIEYQAYFKSPCLPDYLINLDNIHKGTYSGSFKYGKRRYNEKNRYKNIAVNAEPGEANHVKLIYKTPRRKAAINDKLVDQFISSGGLVSGRDITPAALKVIIKRSEIIGRLGEMYVLEYERKRLVRGNRRDLAEKIRWISQETVNKGYDILSFELNGEKRFIEVKTTTGDGMTFVVSYGEWQKAKQLRDLYYLYRVTNIMGKPTIKQKIRNLIQQESLGNIIKTPFGYKVRLT